MVRASSARCRQCPGSLMKDAGMSAPQAAIGLRSPVAAKFRARQH
jgi:hypothetical protein